MTILIILVAIIAFAYIFGREAAKSLLRNLLVRTPLIIIALIILGLVIWGVIAGVSMVWDYTTVRYIVYGIALYLFYLLVLKNKKEDELLSETISKAQEDSGKTNQIVAILALLYILYLVLIPFLVSQPSEIVVESAWSRPYVSIASTNVRKCPGMECVIVGIYPEGTSFDLFYRPKNLPEWIEITYGDEHGNAHTGYIHRSTITTLRK